MMHCPNCGTKATSNQKYCRSCGFGLEKFSQLFEEQSPAVETIDPETEQADDLQRQRRKVERWRNIVATAFLTGVLGTVVGYGAIYRMMIMEGKFLAGSVFLLFLIGAIAAVLLSVWAEELKQATGQREQKQSKTAPEKLPAAETTSKLELEAHREPLLSVTEDTTKSLQAALPAEKRPSGELSN